MKILKLTSMLIAIHVLPLNADDALFGKFAISEVTDPIPGTIYFPDGRPRVDLFIDNWTTVRPGWLFAILRHSNDLYPTKPHFAGLLAINLQTQKISLFASKSSLSLESKIIVGKLFEAKDSTCGFEVIDRSDPTGSKTQTWFWTPTESPRKIADKAVLQSLFDAVDFSENDVDWSIDQQNRARVQIKNNTSQRLLSFEFPVNESIIPRMISVSHLWEPYRYFQSIPSQGIVEFDFWSELSPDDVKIVDLEKSKVIFHSFGHVGPDLETPFSKVFPSSINVNSFLPVCTSWSDSSRAIAEVRTVPKRTQDYRFATLSFVEFDVTSGELKEIALSGRHLDTIIAKPSQLGKDGSRLYYFTRPKLFQTDIREHELHEFSIARSCVTKVLKFPDDPKVIYNSFKGMWSEEAIFVSTSSITRLKVDGKTSGELKRTYLIDTHMHLTEKEYTQWIKNF